jgi:hypothetical protein
MPSKLAMPLSTAHIGRCGELLVQYELLLRGVDSAPLCTDAGIDLVAYAPNSREAQTIQVKTNHKAKIAGGGRGKAALDWWIEENNPAQLVALVDLSLRRIWVFTKEEITDLAQQRSGGRLHLYMYTDPTVNPTKANRLVHSHEFEKFRLENRAHTLFGG